MNPNITRWLIERATLKPSLIPFHISELMEALEERPTPAAIRAAVKHVLSSGWLRWHARRDGGQVWLYVPVDWLAARAAAEMREHSPAIYRQWATIAARLTKGTRVVVRGRVQARRLLRALKAQGVRGEFYSWKDGRCVVTHCGTPPLLLTLCRPCRMGQCGECQEGFERPDGKSPQRCECDHAEFLEHVGYSARKPHDVRTRPRD